MKLMNNSMYGKLIAKANKLGIEGYKRNGVTTILKNNKVIQRVTTDVQSNGLKKSTHIEHFKDGVKTGDTFVSKTFDTNNNVDTAIIVKYKDKEPIKAMASMADENHRLQPFREVDPYQLMIECVKSTL